MKQLLQKIFFANSRCSKCSVFHISLHLHPKFRMAPSRVTPGASSPAVPIKRNQMKQLAPVRVAETELQFMHSRILRIMRAPENI